MGLLAKDFMKNTIYSQKSELDQFFTNKDIAKQCYLELCKLYNINEFDLLLEPSAGDGSFLKLLPENKRLGLDLDPKFEEIKQMDFFDFITDYKNILFENTYQIYGEHPL